MAIGTVEGTDSIAYSREANGWPTGFDHWQTRPQIADMSYDHFGPPMHDHSDPAISRAAYPPGYDFVGRQPPPPHALAGAPPNWQLQRSMSTPDAAGLHHHGADHGSSSALVEKKRNKLGYHRTSVACNHCRRRKIRCIPSASDSHGPCTNCIRLKKDCSFIPTDQQQGGAGDPTRMRGSGSLKVKSEPPSEPSSPGGTIDNSSLKPPSSPPYPPLGTSVAGMPIPASSEDKGMGSSSYGGLDHMPQWMAGSSSSSTADNMSWSNPWQPRPPNSPLPADGNATDPGVPPPPMGWEQPGSAASDAPRDLSWGQMPISADGRSFSYSAESIRSSSQDPAQYVPVGHQGRQTSGSSGPFSIGQPAPEGYHALPHMSMAPPTDPIMSPVGGGVVAAGGVSSQAQHMQWMHQQAYMRSQGAYGGGSWAPGQPRPE